jgi:uncharacterized glyoxalase superfamily protein PhnB
MPSNAPKRIMPIITVPSVDDVRSFYVDTLGFDHQMGVVGKDGQYDFTVVVKDGASLMFSRSRDGNAPAAAAHQTVDIYIEVDDVDGYHDQVKKNKAKITEPLTTQWWGDRTFKVQDPNGYQIWFFENTGQPNPPEGVKIV